MIGKIIRLILFLTATVTLGACSSHTPVADDSAVHPLPDTLRAVTLSGPTSYFIYRGEKMGYDYTLLDSLAAQNGMVLDLRVAPSVAEAVAMLDSGSVDLIAYEVPITGHYRPYVLPCGPENSTTQVLVQPIIQGTPAIADVTDLVGKEVYVENDSKYLRRLQHLNSELGGGITIRTVDMDTIITEDLVRMVSDGSIPLAIVDSDIARLNATYFPGLDTSVEISLPQRAAWGVSPSKPWLADSIDAWFAREAPAEMNRDLLKQFFEQSKFSPTVPFDFSKGYISRYDNLFRQYAPNVGWDWRLMAAQAYVESRFSPSAKSWVGARGLMQIMPSTARGYRTPVSQLNNPETSVRVASRLINDLDRYLVDLVPNDAERQKFVMAAYNAGIAHVFDAIRLADKYGLDPQKWDNNVSKAMLMKMNPKYYNDPVVRYGYSRGSETVAYVDRITQFYEQAQRHIQA